MSSRSLALVYLSILCLQTHLTFSATVPIPSENGEIDAMLTRGGVIGEEEGEEMMMPSEISRRVMMMRKRYISYETLRRDMVPCQKPGASYYACRSGQANSYNRGCSIITRCARDTNDIKT
ncbi:PREDICTED: protein RALF-like 24 [Camelina sativa]|uniref:Protein RALF-like 24 n=2 Tax=Camelina sativa TaxID=90675 RepID=A0ABM0W7C6_CAMSA|nr:PREDICTED: protein RALF-like 24 [Camelina sativa]